MPLLAPTISVTAIRISAMPAPSFTPVMMNGSAPGSAMVRKVSHLLALKLLPTSR